MSITFIVFNTTANASYGTFDQAVALGCRATANRDSCNCNNSSTVSNRAGDGIFQSCPNSSGVYSTIPILKLSGGDYGKPGIWKSFNICRCGSITGASGYETGGTSWVQNAELKADGSTYIQVCSSYGNIIRVTEGCRTLSVGSYTPGGLYVRRMAFDISFAGGEDLSNTGRPMGVAKVCLLEWDANPKSITRNSVNSNTCNSYYYVQLGRNKSGFVYNMFNNSCPYDQSKLSTNSKDKQPEKGSDYINCKKGTVIMPGQTIYNNCRLAADNAQKSCTPESDCSCVDPDDSSKNYCGPNFMPDLSKLKNAGDVMTPELISCFTCNSIAKTIVRSCAAATESTTLSKAKDELEPDVYAKFARNYGPGSYVCVFHLPTFKADLVDKKIANNPSSSSKIMSLHSGYRLGCMKTANTVPPRPFPRIARAQDSTLVDFLSNPAMQLFIIAPYVEKFRDIDGKKTDCRDMKAQLGEEERGSFFFPKMNVFFGDTPRVFQFTSNDYGPQDNQVLPESGILKSAWNEKNAVRMEASNIDNATCNLIYNGAYTYICTRMEYDIDGGTEYYASYYSDSPGLCSTLESSNSLTFFGSVPRPPLKFTSDISSHTVGVPIMPLTIAVADIGQLNNRYPATLTLDPSFVPHIPSLSTLQASLPVKTLNLTPDHVDSTKSGANMFVKGSPCGVMYLHKVCIEEDPCMALDYMDPTTIDKYNSPDSVTPPFPKNQAGCGNDLNCFIFYDLKDVCEGRTYCPFGTSDVTSCQGSSQYASLIPLNGDITKYRHQTQWQPSVCITEGIDWPVSEIDRERYGDYGDKSIEYAIVFADGGLSAPARTLKTILEDVDTDINLIPPVPKLYFESGGDIGYVTHLLNSTLYQSTRPMSEHYFGTKEVDVVNQQVAVRPRLPQEMGLCLNFIPSAMSEPGVDTKWKQPFKLYQRPLYAVEVLDMYIPLACQSFNIQLQGPGAASGHLTNVDCTYRQGSLYRGCGTDIKPGALSGPGSSGGIARGTYNARSGMKEYLRLLRTQGANQYTHRAWNGKSETITRGVSSQTRGQLLTARPASATHAAIIFDDTSMLMQGNGSRSNTDGFSIVANSKYNSEGGSCYSGSPYFTGCTTQQGNTGFTLAHRNGSGILGYGGNSSNENDNLKYNLSIKRASTLEWTDDWAINVEYKPNLVHGGLFGTANLIGEANLPCTIKGDPPINSRCSVLSNVNCNGEIDNIAQISSNNSREVNSGISPIWLNDSNAPKYNTMKRCNRLSYTMAQDADGNTFEKVNGYITGGYPEANPIDTNSAAHPNNLRQANTFGSGGGIFAGACKNSNGNACMIEKTSILATAHHDLLSASYEVLGAKAYSILQDGGWGGAVVDPVGETCIGACPRVNFEMTISGNTFVCEYGGVLVNKLGKRFHTRNYHGEVPTNGYGMPGKCVDDEGYVYVPSVDYAFQKCPPGKVMYTGNTRYYGICASSNTLESAIAEVDSGNELIIYGEATYCDPELVTSTRADDDPCNGKTIRRWNASGGVFLEDSLTFLSQLMRTCSSTSGGRWTDKEGTGARVRELDSYNNPGGKYSISNSNVTSDMLSAWNASTKPVVKCPSLNPNLILYEYGYTFNAVWPKADADSNVNATSCMKGYIQMNTSTPLNRYCSYFGTWRGLSTIGGSQAPCLYTCPEIADTANFIKWESPKQYSNLRVLPTCALEELPLYRNGEVTMAKTATQLPAGVSPIDYARDCNMPATSDPWKNAWVNKDTKGSLAPYWSAPPAGARCESVMYFGECIPDRFLCYDGGGNGQEVIGYCKGGTTYTSNGIKTTAPPRKVSSNTATDFESDYAYIYSDNLNITCSMTKGSTSDSDQYPFGNFYTTTPADPNFTCTKLNISSKIKPIFGESAYVAYTKDYTNYKTDDILGIDQHSMETIEANIISDNVYSAADCTLDSKDPNYANLSIGVAQAGGCDILCYDAFNVSAISFACTDDISGPGIVASNCINVCSSDAKTYYFSQIDGWTTTMSGTTRVSITAKNSGACLGYGMPSAVIQLRASEPTYNGRVGAYCNSVTFNSKITPNDGYFRGAVNDTIFNGSYNSENKACWEPKDCTIRSISQRVSHNVATWVMVGDDSSSAPVAQRFTYSAIKLPDNSMCIDKEGNPTGHQYSIASTNAFFVRVGCVDGTLNLLSSSPMYNNNMVTECRLIPPTIEDQMKYSVEANAARVLRDVGFSALNGITIDNTSSISYYFGLKRLANTPIDNQVITFTAGKAPILETAFAMYNPFDKWFASRGASNSSAVGIYASINANTFANTLKNFTRVIKNTIPLDLFYNNSFMVGLKQHLPPVGAVTLKEHFNRLKKHFIFPKHKTIKHLLIGLDKIFEHVEGQFLVDHYTNGFNASGSVETTQKINEEKEKSNHTRNVVPEVQRRRYVNSNESTVIERKIQERRLALQNLSKKEKEEAKKTNEQQDLAEMAAKKVENEKINEETKKRALNRMAAGIPFNLPTNNEQLTNELVLLHSSAVNSVGMAGRPKYWNDARFSEALKDGIIGDETTVISSNSVTFNVYQSITNKKELKSYLNDLGEKNKEDININRIYLKTPEDDMTMSLVPINSSKSYSAQKFTMAIWTKLPVVHQFDFMEDGTTTLTQLIPHEFDEEDLDHKESNDLGLDNFKFEKAKVTLGSRLGDNIRYMFEDDKHPFITGENVTTKKRSKWNLICCDTTKLCYLRNKETGAYISRSTIRNGVKVQTYDIESAQGFILSSIPPQRNKSEEDRLAVFMRVRKEAPIE